MPGTIEIFEKTVKEEFLTLGELDNVKHTAYALAFTIEQMSIIDKITKPWI